MPEPGAQWRAGGAARLRVKARGLAPLGESIERRRVFWALVALVVLPTLGLAFYGLSGLKNQRDAAEAQLRERYLLQARALEQEIVARLAEEDQRIRLVLQPLPMEQVPAALAMLAHDPGLVDEAWIAEDPGLPAPLREEPVAPEPLSFVSVDDGRGLSTYARSRVRSDLEVVYRLDPAAIDAVELPQVVGRLFPNEQAYYRLVPAVPDPSSAPVSLESLRQDLAQGVLAREPEVDRAMAPPFEHWRITITSIEGPPVASTGGYITIVLGLTATIVLGVTLMGRAVVQQVRLSRLQTDFVSNVSHELRTPLTSIRMFVETLQSGRVQDPEKVQECLGIIAAESERLTRKIERVLSWARIEAGRRVWEMQPVPPRALVDGALAAFSAHQLMDGNPVTVDVPEGLPLVSADQEAIEEALLNLLSNARKYGGADVHIRVEARAERAFVAIGVEDDGPGIPRSERKRIFEKFYRPDLLQTRRAEGSGLGLSIVRAIVVAHRGKVDVESEEGRGSRFTIRLRRA